VEADQVARNDAIYRAANERIEAAAEEYAVAGPIPFICECADATCTNIVLLTLTQYERIRAHPTHFLNLPGHELPAKEHVDVVHREPSFVVVEKKGRAAEIVKELDPR
jgi:hypothetical protein